MRTETRWQVDGRAVPVLRVTLELTEAEARDYDHVDKLLTDAAAQIALSTHLLDLTRAATSG